MKIKNAKTRIKNKKLPLKIRLTGEITLLKYELERTKHELRTALSVAESYRAFWAEEVTKFNYYIGDPINKIRKGLNNERRQT